MNIKHFAMALFLGAASVGANAQSTYEENPCQREQSQACLSYAETKPALALANTLRDPSEMDVAVCGGKKGGRKEGRKIFRPHSHPKPKENHKKRDALLGSTSFHVLSLITMSSEIIRRVSRLSSLFYCYCHRRRRHHHRRRVWTSCRLI